MSDIHDYDYELPRELIAQEPLATRSDARLMVVDRKSGGIDHYHVRDLPDLLNAHDVIVMNNSSVIPARLVGQRTSTGGRWQGLFLRSDSGSGIWEVLTKTRGTLVPGETITIKDRHSRDGMQLVVVARTEDGHMLAFPQLPRGYASVENEELGEFSDPADWLQQFGRIPLPPYIRDGQMVDSDVESYQTVYASQRGSIAAPTAGLHFTEKLLRQIRNANIDTAEVTLHVGIGTFRPIQVESLEQHQMHEEWGQLDRETAGRIRAARNSGGRCVAVGTTSVRVLESAAAVNAGQLAAWTGVTDLFIRPPYTFQAVDVLMTNFHLPRSSLLVLVSAFATRELAMHAYKTAIEHEYRFYSYGDAMLIV